MPAGRRPPARSDRVPHKPQNGTLWAVGATDLTATEPNSYLRPIYLTLRDGSEWQVRAGGSWDGRDDGYEGSYSCVAGYAPSAEVILQLDAPPVDITGDRWTVLVGPLGLGQPFPSPAERVVAKAWFVASTMPAP